MIGRSSRSQRGFLTRMGLPVLLVLLFLGTLLVPNACAQSDEVRVFITGPDAIPVNQSVEYTIRIIGGPAETLGPNQTANWSYEASLGILKPPTAQLTPEKDNSTENIFTITITAPENPKDLTLEVDGSSSNGTAVNSSGKVFKDIEIFKPITVNITAVIRNPGTIDVNDALISFYIEGKMIGNRTESVSANSTKEVYYEWIASKDDRGKEYQVEVRINEDGSLLEFNNGDNVLQTTIYLGNRPPRPQGPIMLFNTGLGFVIGVLASIFALMAFLMWNATRRGRGYYSPGSSYSMYLVGMLSLVLSIPILMVSQILAENPDVAGDPTGKLIEGILIFILGFLIIVFTWDRTRKKKR